MNDYEIENLADDAANVAILHIQQALGVKSGDFAGLYFSSPRYDALLSILEDYIKAEVKK